MSKQRKSKRNVVRRDYKAMDQFGLSGNQGSGDGKLSSSPQGASGFSAALALGQRDSHDSDFDLDTEWVQNPDAEMQKMERELCDLEEAELRLTQQLQKQKELREMRKRLQEKRDRVSSLKGKLKSDSKSEKKSKTDGKVVRSKTAVTREKSPKHEIDLNKSIDIDDLRKDKKLREKVKKELKSLKLFSDSSSGSSESSCSYFDDSSDDDSNDKSSKKKKHKNKKKKSGINAKASDRVKNPQKWPHSHLQFEFVEKQVKYDQLNFQLFCAGELEIISDPDIDETEKSGRLELLKKIIYYYSTYEFKGLKAFYAAWIREIELGKKKWSDDPSNIESAILSKHIMKPTSKSRFSATQKSDSPTGESETTWFCQAYQRNKCKHTSHHMEVYKGKMKFFQHICASCWLKDKKKLGHPECSTSCPHASQ